MAEAQTDEEALALLAATVARLEADPRRTSARNQAWFFASLEASDPSMFERVRALVRAGRLDLSGAALWADPDCNVASGESLLRQVIFGMRYVRERFGVTPAVAWLPDGAGFPNTLPTLLAHAGAQAFVTAKLVWNDGRAFPHARFWWEGPDGSRVLAAPIGSKARDYERRRPVAPRNANLPVVRDELFVPLSRRMRGTRRENEARNAALERALTAAEQTGAWALALHASPFFLDEFRRQLDAAQDLVLRAQSRRLFSGAASRAAYDDVREGYDLADSLIAQTAGNARSVLPHSRPREEAGVAEPSWQGKAYVFSNAHLFARVRADASIVDLRYAGGPNLVRRANRLRGAHATASEIVDGALEIQFRVGRDSLGVARIALGAAERFLRVDVALDWRARHATLRCDNDLRFAGVRARFGSPHGSVDRALRDADVYGQRYARVDGAGLGLALLVLDAYGWRVRADWRGARLEHALLHGAEAGQFALAYAFVPFRALGMGTLERLWEDFALAADVAMFTCDHESLAVVATKIADDRSGVVVRVRECGGLPVAGSIACAARAREVACVDALELPVAGEAVLREGAIEAQFGPYELRSFLVRLG